MGSNRPLHRSLIKIAVRLVMGRSRAHAQDWFPGLKLKRASAAEAGAIWYRGERVGTLSDGSRVIATDLSRVLIIGSGPSIKRNDLSRAEDSSCILLNGALHLVPEVISNPLAVAIEDERFVWRHFELINRTPADCVCLLSVSVIRAICEIDISWLKNRTIVLIDDVRKPYGMARRGAADLRALSAMTLSEDAATGFCKSPSIGVFQAGSVVVSALQFAVCWKPHKIGLLGIDLSNADEPRFYETVDKTYSGIRRAQERIIAHLTMAKEISAAIGIEISNHSPVSALVENGFGYDNAFAKSA